jgi:uridylate kinase
MRTIDIQINHSRINIGAKTSGDIRISSFIRRSNFRFQISAFSGNRYNQFIMPKPASPDRPINAAYSRVLLKISGEGFCHEGSFGIEAPELENIARQCVEVAKLGVQLAIVVGGGNFIRGATFAEDGNIPRATADYMGMLATVINAVALQETMEKMGQPTRVQSAISVYSVCEPFIRRRAVRHLEKGRVLILAAGTGNPFFTTDTCAALRATEIGADVLLKATKVDGIYSADPKKNPKAELLQNISYERVLTDKLRVMDLTAITLCMERKIPLVVFNLKTPGNVVRVIKGEDVGTKIVPE